MLASDMTDMTFFPVGTILMMDGSWTDGRGGWYICDGQEKNLPNETKQRTPNLTNKFIRGGGPEADGKIGADSQSITLTTNHLPAHNHSITDNGHNHLQEAHSHLVGSTVRTDGFQSNEPGKYAGSDTQASQSVTATNKAAVTNISIKNAGLGQAFTVDTVPAYYAVIYIKKMV